MKFCQNCNNMYYIGINTEDQNKITYYCRYCSHKDETMAQENVCVLNSQLKNREQKFSHIINQYTKMDPTLPRIYNMKCPNTECKTNEDGHTKETEIIYIRYDDDNLKYVYLCAECNFIWKTNEHK